MDEGVDELEQMHFHLASAHCGAVDSHGKLLSFRGGRPVLEVLVKVGHCTSLHFVGAEQNVVL